MAMDDPALPFEEGQVVETKSFITGFRGAWFRCKIDEISWKKNRVGHRLFYLDFPDEKKKWTASYQVPPTIDSGSSTSKRRRERAASHKEEEEPEKQLMLRPEYPPIYRKNGPIPASASSELRVVIDGDWHVGDPVDWLTDGCYWSGTVTQILDKEKAMVELLPSPLGEGESYEARLSDLRPTLDWSLETSWTVPSPEDFAQRVQILFPEQQAASNEPVRCNIRIEQPVPMTPVTSPDDLADSEQARTAETVTKTPENDEIPAMSETVEVPLVPGKMKTPEDAGPSGSGKMKSLKDIDASLLSDKRKAPEDNEASPAKAPENAEAPATSYSFRAPEIPKMPLFSDRDDSLEAVVMDFEELATKLSFLKDVLQFGFPLPDDASPASWEFVEHRNSPNP